MDVIKEEGEVEADEQSKSKVDTVIENCGEINIKDDHWYCFIHLEEIKK